MPKTSFPAEADPIRANAAEVYIQTYPLLMADAIRRAHPLGFHQFQIAPQDAESLAPGLSEDDARVIVVTAWIDLTHGPVILRIPRTGGRYLSLTLYDTAGEPFMCVGSRTGDDAGLDLAVVSPKWRGELPSGLKARRAPSEFAWAVCRIHAHSLLDRAATLAVAKRLCLAVVPPDTMGLESATTVIAAPAAPLVRQVAEVDPATLFHRLPGLLDRAPDSFRGVKRRRVEALLAKLEGPPPVDAWSPEFEKTLAMGLADGMGRIEAAARAVMRPERGGWADVFRSPVEPVVTPLSAAVHAYLAAGAPSSDDLMLLVCEHDVMGQPLTGEHNYRIHFEPGTAPPMDAYWSLHARPAPSYGNRHGLGSRDELVASADGSLDLALQRQSPSRRLTANWLICPASRFALTMRVYSPWPAAVQGAWRMPAVERVDDQVEATRSGSVRRHRPPQIPMTDSRRKSDALAMIWRPSP